MRGADVMWEIPSPWWGSAPQLYSGVLVGPYVKRFGERRSVLSGLFFGTVGFAGFAFATRGWMLLAVIPFIALWGHCGACRAIADGAACGPFFSGEVARGDQFAARDYGNGGAGAVYADFYAGNFTSLRSSIFRAPRTIWRRYYWEPLVAGGVRDAAQRGNPVG